MLCFFSSHATAANHPIFSRLAKTRLAAASGTILILTLGGLTFAQCRIYKNGESFFGDTLAQNPTAWVAWSNVGNALARRGDLDAALDYYHHALVINPKDNETIHKIGLALIAKGKPAESIEYLKIPQYPQAIADLGIAYYLTSRGAEAEEQFRRALDANPNLASAHYYLGLILMQRNDLTQAIAEFRAALRANPDLAEASFNLAVALLRTSSPEEGMLHMRRAITLKPELREAAEKLGIGIVP
ncbi:tetratricopeptide repeat protein [Candidatus Sumerlaeota bacterium]|nr:tetratricopeptide repeat protein [Candidatus Sumerlaeota bacterium]